MDFNPADVQRSLPLLIVSAGGIVVLLLEAFSRVRSGADAQRAGRGHLAAITLAILAIAAGFSVAAWGDAAAPRSIYQGMLAVDRFAIFLNLTLIAGAALTVMLAGGFMREHRFEFGEFYALVLLATAGMMIFVQAVDLVALFIGIETMSLAIYVLTGSWRKSSKSSEAAMKYFLVGAFASAVLIYGIALVYGTSGTTQLNTLATAGPSLKNDPIFLIGTILILAAFAFKIAAAPFHMWAPDTYEGAPTPVTAFMSAAVKAAGFGALIRLLSTSYGELSSGPGGWVSLLSILAILTMIVGNAAALRQESIKRMLAYSSIAHAGYLLVGVVAMGTGGQAARSSLLYYLLSYTLTTAGSFGIVAWYSARADERTHLDDWAGMGARHPAAALAMTVLLLSLAGLPPTAGFFGKLYLFRVALAQKGLVPLVILAVGTSLVSVYYYLRVVTAMYFREPTRETAVVRSFGTSAALVVATLGTILVGVFPSWFIDAAANASLLTK